MSSNLIVAKSNNLITFIISNTYTVFINRPGVTVPCYNMKVTPSLGYKAIHVTLLFAYLALVRIHHVPIFFFFHLYKTDY